MKHLMNDPLPSPTHPINQESLAYWLKKRGGRLMPSRRDLDPIEIPRLLASVVLIDVLSDPLDFRYRLIGTAIEYHLHRTLVGKRMREIAHQMPGSIIWSTLESVLVHKHPVTSEIPYVGPHKDYKMAEDMIMPLSNDGQRVNMLFVTVAYWKK